MGSVIPYIFTLYLPVLPLGLEDIAVNSLETIPVLMVLIF